MPAVILDACGILNLYASGQFLPILTALRNEWYLPAAVEKESQQYRQPDPDEPEKMNPKPLIRRMQLGCALAVAIFAVLSVVSYRAVSGLREGYNWVRHTHEVIEDLGSLLSSMQDLESSDRRYALIGDEAALTRYHEGLAHADEELKKLRRSVADNAEQQRRAVELVRLVGAKIAFAQEIVHLRQQRKKEKIAALLAGGTGERARDKVRAAIGEMQAEEQRLLTLREEAAERSTNQVKSILLTGMLLIFAIASLVAWMVRRDTTRATPSPTTPKTTPSAKCLWLRRRARSKRVLRRCARPSGIRKRCRRSFAYRVCCARSRSRSTSRPMAI